MNERKDDVSQLQKLGGDNKARYDNPGIDILEVFPNVYPDSQYSVTFNFPEFTSLCPRTGQPDHAHITIVYTPAKSCIETKSLKFYLQAYRNHKSFMETNTNKILNDLVFICSPKDMLVRAEFTPRGGIQSTIEAEYGCPF
jgi:7-cyano-7-deazaguanine reductase